jgi:DNA processing protein
MSFSRPPQDPGLASEPERVASVGLGMLPGIGPRSVKRWIELAGSAEAVWRMLPTLLGARPGRDEVLAAWRALDPRAVVDAASARGVTVLAYCDPGYPARLRDIPDPPPALFVRGRVDNTPAVAVVGSRRATPYGRAAAGRLARDLSLAGLVVVSGMARGVDAAAHQAALEAGGVTVAVLGCGPDVVYPREHRRLADAIAAGGALVSEFTPGTLPLPGHFPRRNRLISGLAAGVVVVEGAEDSGALVTADYALDQGREVFAVPGSIFSPRSGAPHLLLRQGAALAERAEDILEVLRLAAGSPGGAAAASAPGRTGADASGVGSRPGGEDVGTAGAKAPAPGGDEARLLRLLAAGPQQLDDLVEASALPASRVAALITVLELRGIVQALPGQMVMLTSRGGVG